MTFIEVCILGAAFGLVVGLFAMAIEAIQQKRRG